MATTEVIFEYDEPTSLWSVRVVGVETQSMARHAFSAVVLTCQALDPRLLTKTLIDPLESGWKEWKVTPAVLIPSQRGQNE